MERLTGGSRLMVLHHTFESCLAFGFETLANSLLGVDSDALLHVFKSVALLHIFKIVRLYSLT